MNVGGDEGARIEAAYSLTKNHAGVVKFACRGPGKTASQAGKKSFQAPLSDPNAVPELSYESDVDSCLRVITRALINGNWRDMKSDLNIKSGQDSDSDKLAVYSALEYLKRRVGVPRDMSYPAARQLRAHLSHVQQLL